MLRPNRKPKNISRFLLVFKGNPRMKIIDKGRAVSEQLNVAHDKDLNSQQNDKAKYLDKYIIQSHYTKLLVGLLFLDNQNYVLGIPSLNSSYLQRVLHES